MNLSLNNTNNTVLKDGTEKQLTSKEFGILSFLMDHPDEIHTAEEIYENVWKEEPFRCRSIICVHICHIRENQKVLTPKKSQILSGNADIVSTQLPSLEAVFHFHATFHIN